MSITTAPSPSARPTRVRYYVLAALLVITSINYVQRNSIGAAETTIRTALQLDMRDTGDAISAFFLTYALLQVPSGWLAQRLGARATLTLYAAGWSVCTGLCALASGLFDLYAARLAMGALQAGIFPCCTLILASWYPPSRRGLAVALLNSFMLIGGTIGVSLTAILLGPLGWRFVFALYMLPGLAWAAWFVWWFRNLPEQHPEVNEAERAIISEGRASADSVGQPGASIPWVAILMSGSLWLLCIQQAFRAGTNRFYDTWLPTYFQEARGADVQLAGLLTALPLLFGIFGGPVGGMLSDYVLKRTGSRSAARKGVAVGSLLAGTLLFLLAYPIGNVWLATLLFSAGVFLTTFASPCSYALSMDISGKHVAVVFGVFNMVGNLGSWAFIKYLPRLIPPSEGASQASDWDLALAVFAGLNVAAALCWLFIRPEQTIGEPQTPEAPHVLPAPDGPAADGDHRIRPDASQIRR